MREILFRGRSVDSLDDGEWIYGYYNVHRGGLDDEYHDYIREKYMIDHEVDPDTVSQFTGLLDKNGNKIFSGDIVSTKYGRLCGVSWFKSQAFNGWNFRPIEYEHKAPDEFDLWSNLTVVGNKWDNPELLNEDVRDGT